jgi:hypothetical protein
LELATLIWAGSVEASAAAGVAISFGEVSSIVTSPEFKLQYQDQNLKIEL